MTTTDRFRADLDALAAPGARLGIALSGGPDSLALLLLAAAARPGAVEAATVDHALRTDSRAEAEAAAAICARLGVPHVILTIDWPERPNHRSPGTRPRRALPPARRLGRRARTRRDPHRPPRRRPGRDPADAPQSRRRRPRSRGHAADEFDPPSSSSPRTRGSACPSAPPARLAPRRARAYLRGRGPHAQTPIPATPTTGSSASASARRCPTPTGSTPAPSPPAPPTSPAPTSPRLGHGPRMAAAPSPKRTVQHHLHALRTRQPKSSAASSREPSQR